MNSHEPKKDELFVSSKHLAEMLSIPVYTILKLTREKVFPAYGCTSRYLYDPKEIIEIVKKSRKNK